MHLGNGAITPECAALTYGAAAAGLAVAGGCLLRSRTRHAASLVEKLQLALPLGCAVFAAQAVNVQIAPGMSGHFVGGVLLACTLGPALGAWTMAIVLAVQTLALGDGGIAALGANLLNMALLPAGIVALSQRAFVSRAKPTVARGSAAAGLSVVVAAVLIVGETAAFRSFAESDGWTAFASRMLIYHLWIGVLEGLATGAFLAFSTTLAHYKPAPRLMLGLSIAAILAALGLPISSSLPDGYQAAAEQSGIAWLIEE